jgi:hypothetical protein
VTDATPPGGGCVAIGRRKLWTLPAHELFQGR